MEITVVLLKSIKLISEITKAALGYVIPLVKRMYCICLNLSIDLSTMLAKFSRHLTVERVGKKTLGYVLHRAHNNFDFVRLLCALTVVIFHSYYLFEAEREGLGILSAIRQRTGGLAVYIFFFLSGIFITGSFINAGSLLRFVVMRLLRIWPALIVCLLVIVFIIGPAVSTYPLDQYFAARGTWNYMIHGLLLYHLRFELPGVFISNYMTAAVNGSLWTLPIEVFCYLMVLSLGVFDIYKNKIIAVIVYTGMAIMLYFGVLPLQDFLSTPFPFFIAGSLCYFLKEHLVISNYLLIVLSCLWLILDQSFLLYATVLYGALIVGSSRYIKSIRLPGDYSYGVYIYGFPIQQTIAFYQPGLTPAASNCISIMATLLIACASWHLIEYPANKFGKNILSSRVNYRTELLKWF